MLKKRIAAALIVRDGVLVQSIHFKKYLPVGIPEIAAEFLNSWGVDELVLLDISASKEKRSIAVDLVKRVAAKSFVPLTVGGGITQIGDVETLIQTGADKVTLNQALYTHPNLVTEIAHKYGNQCVVATLDVIKKEDGHYAVYDYVEKRTRELNVFSWIKELENKGVGELLINTVHKDGSYTGFDTNLINAIKETAGIPVIAMGGAGHPGHFVNLFRETTADAGCAGNFFHFSEHSVIITKRELLKHNINVRLETYASYQESEVDERYRLNKKQDAVLEKMRFIKIEKEVI